MKAFKSLSNIAAALFFCMVVAMPVAASEGDVASISDLENLLGDQTDVQSLEGSFEQGKYIADLDTTLDSSGRFEFDADTGLVWNIQKPVATLLKISGEEIVEEQDGEVVMRMDVDDQPMTQAISEVFFAIFGGDWQALSERFSIHTLQKEAPWRFELKPKGDMLKSHLKRVELQGKDYLNQLVLEETNGDRTEIRLHDVKAR
ncbi:Outer membrane lipoprotein carrier protein LolA [Marinobacter persicus]|uniref:Outer membrane lipoprotein carrier protein LolA n=1 Tax=Marinobacter persicus TaxID=930118 RepID=A0A1I3WPE2_9GAMM|nr:outer membrane lipoprotein carrier protein LolA [Marinobacter persicus]GHD48064.1 hypothetical protein GCM10008110_16640 [Marinobacter persicus]SFK09053.1 Outer membrane lipoprotein carrier protein LolA [Marinobacter persicus]